MPPDHPQRDCAPASPCRGIFLANAGRRQDTLAHVRSLLKRVPRQKRMEVTWQHVEVEASRHESPEDAAVALKLALQLDHVPYSVESGLKGRKK